MPVKLFLKNIAVLRYSFNLAGNTRKMVKAGTESPIQVLRYCLERKGLICRDFKMYYFPLQMETFGTFYALTFRQKICLKSASSISGDWSFYLPPDSIKKHMFSHIFKGHRKKPVTRNGYINIPSLIDFPI